MPDGQNVNAANFSASGTGAITGNTTVGGTLGVTGDATFDTSTLKVDSTNNRVGVGTTSPDYVFEIETAENAIANFKSTDANANIRFTDSNSTANGYAGIGAIGDDLTLIAGNDNRMKIDSAGHVTMPNQSAFQVIPASQQANIGDSTQLVFGTEIFDNNADFSSNTFTAPVTGKYQLQIAARIDNVDTAANFCRIVIQTSNRNYVGSMIDPAVLSSDPGEWNFNFSVLADMDANDTSIISWSQSGGADQADVETQTIFSGYLVC